MEKTESLLNRAVNRRSFMKKRALAASAATAGIAVLGSSSRVFGQESEGSPTKGDIAILRFPRRSRAHRVGPLDSVCGTGWYRR
jgi:anaerobic selenocysteine-containing dehydrogenase